MSQCFEEYQEAAPVSKTSSPKKEGSRQNKRRLKSTADHLAPDIIRYLASYTKPDDDGSLLQSSSRQQDDSTSTVATTSSITISNKKYDLVELHSRLAEELHVFLDSMIVLLIFDRSGYVSHQAELLRSETTTTVMNSGTMATEDIRVALQRALNTTSLFPDIDPDAPITSKLARLHEAHDAAMIQGKVS
jgi:hypothetical protein